MTKQMDKASISKALKSVDEVVANVQIEWLIIDELHVGLSLLTGPQNAGKSALALDYALRLSEEASVILVGEDIQAYRDRLEAWMQHHGKAGNRLYFDFNEWLLVQSADRKEFVSRVSLLVPQFIVIDPIERYLPSEAERISGRTVNLLIEGCREIQQLTGASILLVCDSDKPAFTGDTLSNLIAGCDAAIAMEYDADKEKTILRSVKSVTGSRFPSRYLNLVDVELSSERHAYAVSRSKKVYKSEPIKKRQFQVLQALQDSYPNGIRLPELCERTSITPATMGRIINKFKATRFAVQEGHGAPILITPQGSAALESSDETDDDDDD